MIHIIIIIMTDWIESESLRTASKICFI